MLSILFKNCFSFTGDHTPVILETDSFALGGLPGLGNTLREPQLLAWREPSTIPCLHVLQAEVEVT